MTPIDRAHAAMEAASDDAAARMGFYARVADAELVLVLRSADGDRVEPQIFPVDGTDFVLAFDTELRLAEFCGDGADYLSASGRQIAQMLGGQGAGLALNLGAPSATLLPPDALDWLIRTLADAPEPTEARPTAIRAPGAVPQAVLAALDAKLATMEGLALAAHLVTLDYDGRAGGDALIFEDAVAAAQPAMAAAVAEALRFSGIEAGSLDVLFMAADHRMMPQVRARSLRFDLPQRDAPAAPGSDPDRPPILR